MTLPKAPSRSAPPPISAGLYALCDDGFRSEISLEEKAWMLFQGGVRVLQLRMKHTPVRVALSVARAVVRQGREVGACVLVNDRVDWALLSEADGVHLGEEDLPPEEARKVLGPSAVIGVTVRNAAMARRAAEAGASYVGAGPVFPTQTKSVPAAPLGLEGLQVLVAESPLPVVAIGGLTLERLPEIARAGAHGAAVLSDLLGAKDIPAQARALAAAFSEGTPR